MADDDDVEALLEAPYRKESQRGRGSYSSDEDDKRRHKKKRSHRHSRSRSRSPHRRKHRQRSPEFRRRTHSRSPRKRPPKYPGSPEKSPEKQPSPEMEEPSEERDKRTVMCMQLAARVGKRELEEFFASTGKKVKSVRMIADKNSRRSKGIAYVEFQEYVMANESIRLSGTKLFGVPIMIQPTMSEKNRVAAAAQNLKKAEGPRKLYVGSLHYNINEIMLKAVFAPFGQVVNINIQRESNGTSKGYGFIEFAESESAEAAMKHLNGFELAGRPLKVNHVTERDPNSMEVLDAEDSDIGVGMTPASRVALMAKLSEGHNAGLSAPLVPQPLANLSSVTSLSPCFKLIGMFDPYRETEPDWHLDIQDDVLEECNKYGNVVHIYVDKTSSEGVVFVKCQTPAVAAAAFNSLNGRFFAGKQIKAIIIPEFQYHSIFPNAVSASIPLKQSS
ncbi:RNA-binding protein 39-like isoform X2 [Dysidea avara]|uniref:RNA-binding protein 39-like isoform X2 n=1 Tax=Dysidea avara TaxID=196820 RepID=UPI00331BB428